MSDEPLETPSQRSEEEVEFPNENEEVRDIESAAPKELEIGSIREKKADLEIRKSQESTRNRIANWLLGTYTATIVGVFVIISFTEVSQEDRKEVILLIITSQATLVGSALGFYFGQKN